MPVSSPVDPTSRHPCVPDHPCDHCYLCDVIGVCCMTVSADERTQLEADHRAQHGGLRAAIAEDAGTTPSLSELIRLDAERQRPALLLPKSSLLALPQAAAEGVPNDSRKEAIYVIPARSN